MRPTLEWCGPSVVPPRPDYDTLFRAPYRYVLVVALITLIGSVGYLSDS